MWIKTEQALANPAKESNHWETWSVWIAIHRVSCQLGFAFNKDPIQLTLWEGLSTPISGDLGQQTY